MMNKTYAFSDLHGKYNLLKSVLNYCDSKDHLFYLGDAIDRGEDNLKTLLTLLNDKRVTFLKGNHEDFLLNYLLLTDKWEKQIFINYWKGNGGEATLKDLSLCNKSNKDFLIKNLKEKTLLKFNYKNKNGQTILLSHAGGNLETKINSESYLWSRKHFEMSWNEREYSNTYIIHGHTPVQYFNNFSNSQEKLFIYKYANNHKFDIDLGTFLSKQTVLLNLDTFKEIYFRENKKGEVIIDA